MRDVDVEGRGGKGEKVRKVMIQNQKKEKEGRWREGGENPIWRRWKRIQFVYVFATAEVEGANGGEILISPEKHSIFFHKLRGKKRWEVKKRVSTQWPGWDWRDRRWCWWELPGDSHRKPIPDTYRPPSSTWFDTEKKEAFETSNSRRRGEGIAPFPIHLIPPPPPPLTFLLLLLRLLICLLL